MIRKIVLLAVLVLAFMPAIGQSIVDSLLDGFMSRDLTIDSMKTLYSTLYFFVVNFGGRLIKKYLHVKESKVPLFFKVVTGALVVGAAIYGFGFAEAKDLLLSFGLAIAFYDGERAVRKTGGIKFKKSTNVGERIDLKSEFKPGQKQD